jgi:hypothetical protein
MKSALSKGRRRRERRMGVGFGAALTEKEKHANYVGSDIVIGLVFALCIPFLSVPYYAV